MKTKVYRDNWLKQFVEDDNQRGGLLRSYFTLTYQERETIRKAIHPQKCTYCGGDGLVWIDGHDCDCEYCNRYESGHDEDCGNCEGTGERFNSNDMQKAIEIFKRLIEPVGGNQ